MASVMHTFLFAKLDCDNSIRNRREKMRFRELHTKYKWAIIAFFAVIVVAMLAVPFLMAAWQTTGDVESETTWASYVAETYDVDENGVCTCGLFTTSATFDGTQQLPQPTTKGEEYFGDDVKNNWFTNAAGETVSPINAGEYTIKITDSGNGQVICSNHTFTINPIEYKVTNFTKNTKKIYFSGDDTTLRVIWNSNTSEEKAFTTGKVEDFAVNAKDTYTLTVHTVSSGEDLFYHLFHEELGLAHGEINYTDNKELFLKNYKVENPDIDPYTVLPTCYSNNSDGTIFYGTLDNALTQTASANTANTKLVAMKGYETKIGDATYVFSANPNEEDGKINDNGELDEAGTKERFVHTHTITGGANVKVASNVTLILPYKASAGTFEGTVEAIAEADRASKNGYETLTPNEKGFYEWESATGYTVKSQAICVNHATLTNTLTVNGHIEIAGITGFPYPSRGIQGITSGHHASLKLEDGAKLTIPEASKSTTMTINGYIYGGGEVIAKTGKIIMPFAIYDYWGGTDAIGKFESDGKICPFSVYNMPNIQSKLTCNGGSDGVTIEALVSLFTGSFKNDTFNINVLPRYNFDSFTIFGTSNALIQMAETTGTAVFEYAQDYTTGGYVPSSATVTKVTLNGKASSGNISMSISLGLEQYAGILDLLGYSDPTTISFSSVKFPIANTIQLYLTGDYDYTFNTAYKFMPGAELHIKDKANVTISNGAGLMFYDGIDSSTARYTGNNGWNTANFIWAADKGGYNKTAIAKSAKCYIYADSSLTVPDGATFAGYATALGSNATLALSANSTLSITEAEGNGTMEVSVPIKFGLENAHSETQNANGLIFNVDTGVVGGNFSKGVTYFSENTDSGYAWHNSNVTMTYNLGYNDNNETVTDETAIVVTRTVTANATDGIGTLYRPSRTDHKFLGWYTDTTYSTLVTDATTIKYDTTLYALWEKAQVQMYPIEYDPNYPSEEFSDAEFSGGSISEPAGSFSDVHTICNWNTNKERPYYLVGWSVANDGTVDVGIDGTIYTPITIPEGGLTLYAIWDDKIHVTIDYNTNNLELTTESAYLNPGVYEYKITGNVLNGDEDIRNNLSFGGWSTSDNYQVNSNNVVTINNTSIEEVIVTAQWDTKYEFYVHTNMATATYNYSGSDITLESDKIYYAYPNQEVKIVVTYSSWSSTDSRYAKVFSTWQKTTDSKSDWEGETAGNSSLNKKIDATQKYTFYATGDASCLAAGTLVTLADGTVKKIEDVLLTDKVLAFDHETGQFVAADIMLIETHNGWGYYDIINAQFSNGTTVRIINEHGFFDLTLNKYVYITEDNYSEFIGHEFAFVNGTDIETVTLEKVFITNEYTGIYNIVTKYHLNCLSDGLLSMSGSMEGTFNIFEYGDGLKYDEEKMQADIEKYGLFTYEDFAAHVPKEVFDMFPAQYFKVSIGKGYTTYEDLLALADEYLIKHGYYDPKNY